MGLCLPHCQAKLTRFVCTSSLALLCALAILVDTQQQLSPTDPKDSADLSLITDSRALTKGEVFLHNSVVGECQRSVLEWHEPTAVLSLLSDQQHSTDFSVTVHTRRSQVLPRELRVLGLTTPAIAVFDIKVLPEGKNVPKSQQI
jgi:hypothetical protein